MEMRMFGRAPNKEIEQRNKKIPDALPKIGQHMLVCACTGSGKSQLISNLLAGPYRMIFDRVYFIHPQYDKDIYKDAFDIPEDQVYRVFDESATIERILADAKKGGESWAGLVVVDDSMELWRRSKKLNDFLTWCRHHNVAVWAAVQYCKNAVSKLARQQFTSYVLFPGNCKDEDLEAMSGLSPHGRDSFYAAFDAVRRENDRTNSTYGNLHMNARSPNPFYLNMVRPIKLRHVEQTKARKTRADSPDPGEGTSSGH